MPSTSTMCLQFLFGCLWEFWESLEHYFLGNGLRGSKLLALSAVSVASRVGNKKKNFFNILIFVCVCISLFIRRSLNK